jgi:hypothetical protein
MTTPFEPWTNEAAGVQVRSTAGAETLQLLVRPTSFRIPTGEPRRERPRAAELRGDDYDEKFDFDTLFYDVFRSRDEIIAVGPPLLNLREPVRRWRFDADGVPAAAPHLIELECTQRAVFRRFPGTELGITASGSPRAAGRIGADLAFYFAGTRAMMTVQLDNDLEWISDWVDWHHRAHGTNAVIVYDNGSTRYMLDDLLEAITRPGIRVAAIVDWPFRYGPQGSATVPWDSAFAQAGAIEHARRRALRQAAGILSIDIDELVHLVNGRDVYQLAAESAFGIVSFAGTWAYANPTAPPALARHIDCRWVRALDEPAERKWCAVPRRLPDRVQLVVHSARGVPGPHSSTSAFWHMRPISTGWKVNRAGVDHSVASYSIEPELERQLGERLGSGATAASAERRLPRTPVLLWRRTADLGAYTYFHLREYAHRMRSAH